VLRVLSLAHNKITHVPAALFELSSVRTQTDSSC
jgi:hypothetical protein